MPRTLIIHVPITRQSRDTFVEIPLGHLPFLDPDSVANVQAIGALPRVRFERKLGTVAPNDLDACDHEGAVRIRRRNGRTFTIRPDSRPERILALPNLRARLKRIFPKVLPPEQTCRADKLLAGE